jgi:hypothetical protein
MIIRVNVFLLAQVHYMVMMLHRLAKLVILNVHNVLAQIFQIVKHVLMDTTGMEYQLVKHVMQLAPIVQVH